MLDIRVSVSELEFYTNSPGTEFEGPATTVSCAFGSLGFGITYESYRLQTHLSAVIALSPEKLGAIAMEIADVQIYLIRLADELGVVIPDAVRQKIAINEARY